jgi:hypothetical protein
MVLKVVDWIHLSGDRDKWRALVSMITNLPFPQTPVTVSAERLLAYKTDCLCIDLVGGT